MVRVRQLLIGLLHMILQQFQLMVVGTLLYLGWNPTAGLTSMADNTVNTNGNMSGIDNGYVQGRLRRAIASAGGIYGYVLGLDPAAAGAQRGMQYVHLDFGALKGLHDNDVYTIKKKQGQ